MSTHIIAVVDDLFFAAKIRGTAEQVGASISMPRSIESAIESAIANQPRLIICDLNSLRINPFELARALKGEERTAGIPMLGFFSHVQVEQQRQAVEAGFDRVIPRSVFAKSLVEILSVQA
jgi:chemosensory pili system protein ChpA (sensor histidine kinase/response regulator)